MNGSTAQLLDHEPETGSVGTSPPDGAGHDGARGRDLGRAGARRAHTPVGQVRGGEEAPTRADERAHADAGVGLLVHGVDVAVAGGHRLVPPVHHAGVGIAGTGVERRGHGLLGNLQLAHAGDVRAAPRALRRREAP